MADFDFPVIFLQVEPHDDRFARAFDVLQVERRPLFGYRTGDCGPRYAATAARLPPKSLKISIRRGHPFFSTSQLVVV
jgi:hypothetical protein